MSGVIRLVAGTADSGEGPPPDADVIILTLGRVVDSCAAIASALAQTGVCRRVLVLDQGSTAAELAVLAAAVAGRADAALYRSDHNLGVAGGRNALSALGRGRVIVGLDNDASFADETTLARMVAALDAEAGLAAIGCRILCDADGRDDLSSWGYPAALLPHAGGSFAAVTFVGAGHAIRRAAWDDAGGYDPALFFCWEEHDFCLRAIARGWSVVYRGDLVIRHRVAPEARVTWSGRRWFQFVRNRLYIARKTGVSWPGLAPRIAAYLVKGARHGLIRPTLGAIAAAVRMPVAPIRLPAAARAYLLRHDRLPRGGLWQRWRSEVWGRLPAPPVGAVRAGDASMPRGPAASG